MFDHDKLSPGPWHIGGTTYTPSGPKMNVWTKPTPGMQSGDVVAWNMKPEDAAFVEASRNALAIQLETGWHAERSLDDLSAWFVVQTFMEMFRDGHEKIYHPTPVHAILAAWEWMKKREGK